MLAEEVAPFLADEEPIGLQRVLDEASLAVALLQLDGLAVEGEWPQKCLSAVPGEGHGYILGLRLDVLADVALEEVLGHHRAGRRVFVLLVQALLVEIVAVVAAHVAGSACGLGHDVYGAML